MTVEERLSDVAHELADVVAELAAKQLAAPSLDPPDRLFSIRQAADRLGIGRTTAYQLLASGELRSVKVRGRRLVPSSSIVDFIHSGVQ